MPKYVVDGQVYDIGDADVKSFEQAYPNAMQKYVVGEKKYNVPLAKRDKFLGEFKDAVAIGLEGGGSAAGKVEDAGLDDAAAAQEDASDSAVADAGKAKPFVDMSADPYVFAQMGAPYHYGASNKAEYDKAVGKEQAEAAAKAARRAQWNAEDSEIAKTYAPARPSSADEVMANYRGMFDLTEDGKRLNASIDKRIKDLQDAYFQEYQGTPAYKDIVKAQEALGNRLKEGFWQKYGDRYKADMEQAYGGMQGMTQAEVERAIKKRGKELQDAYFKEYQRTDEYKAIASEQDALEKRLNDEFGAAYNGRLNDDMEGDYGKYNAALMERYGDRINAESKPFVTADYDKELIGRMDVNERMRRDYGKKYDDWYARFQSDHDARRKKFDPTTARIGGYAGLGGAMQIKRESTPLQQEGAELRYNMSYLEHANRLDKQSKNILDEARRKGNTNFLSGLARGFGQNITWRDFTFGLADLEDSWRLKIVMRKAEEDPESLTQEETMLLDALTDNMAITAYYSDDLGKGYKAGQTTAVSIPFMLEMMANPIAGSGNAMAKSLLKYGLRKYGVSLAKKRALKMGTRILTDAAAATGMTLTTGAAGVAADANNRIVQDYDISKGEDGTYRVKRKGEVSDADAWTKAFLTRTLENQSEMFFNAFDGGGRVVADLFKPASSKVANTAAGKWAKEMIAAAGRTDIGQFVRGAIKNPTMRGLAKRANFHGIGGEYLEEVYNNLVSIPLGETTWEEATDFDNNLETFIGLAPTSFVFGMFGAGGYMRDRYRINKQLSGMYDAADEQQRTMMTSIREAVLSGDRDGLKIQLGRILGSDLPAEVKRSLLDYTYKSQMAEAMDAADQVSADDRAQEARAQVESVADLANGAVVTVDRIHADGSTEAGHVVGWMDGSPMWIPDSDPSAQPVALRADEYDQGQMTSVPLDEARTQAADDAYRQESERVERETRYSPDITPYVSLVPGESFADADGNTYTVAMRGAGGTVVFDREDQNGGVTSVQLDEEAYMELVQGGIDAAEAASQGGGPIIIGGGYQPSSASEQAAQAAYLAAEQAAAAGTEGQDGVAGQDASNEAAPGADNQTDNRTDGQEAGDSNMSGQDADVQSDETKNVPAMQRIPKDEQGNPLYEQTDSDTAWDAIVEQTDGDEVMAQTVADGMVADKEDALKKLEKAKSKGGATIAEKIAAEKKRKADIDAARQQVDIWRKIAGTADRRKMEVEAARRRAAEAEAALRKAEEERKRAEREDAERITENEPVGDAGGGSVLHGTPASDAEGGGLAGQGQPDGASDAESSSLGSEGNGKVVNRTDDGQRRSNVDSTAGSESVHQPKSGRKVLKNKEQPSRDSKPTMLSDIPSEWKDSEIQAKEAIPMNSPFDIPDEAFTEYTQSVILPRPSEGIEKAIGGNTKSILIKRGVFAKNDITHGSSTKKALTPEESKKILNYALYEGTHIGKTQPATKPNYWVVIKSANKNDVVVIEVSQSKDYIEVVGWEYRNEKGLRNLYNQANNNGGEIVEIEKEGESEDGLSLIQDTDVSSAADLSALTSSSSADKGSKNVQTDKGESEKVAVEADAKPKMAGGRRKAKGAQRKRMRMMESLARKLGYGIVWHDTMDENGLFDPETRTIHIALDAEVQLAAVFGHETMHKIAENRKDYESVRDLARNVLGKEEFRRRVDECERRYRDAGYDKPRGYYEEEAVCDFMGEMLYNAGLLERVCWDANHRVLAAIRDVIDRILAALDLSDENMMRIRLTVSAAYKRAIERAKVEDAGSASGERRFSLLRKEEVDARSAEYHAKHDTGVTQEVYDAAQRAMDSMYGMMLPYYDATALGRRMLPEERYGGKDAKSTIFENGSYGKTMENTLKCIRTLAYNEFTDDVKRVLGRPLTQKESFLASQMVYDIAADPQCLYCYVSLDRKAYDEFLLRYMQQRDEVLDKFRAMGEKGRDIGDAAPHQALSDLYGEYLSGRKDTKEQRSRFDMWIRNEMDGVRAVGGADLATADVRSAVLSGLDESMARQVRDAEKYAQSASWAKKDVDYISYIGELLRLSPAWIKKLTGEYGLRFYSFSEYTPAFLLENMQMVRDAALRGLRGLGYTKEVDFVKVFAPTGMNINCSCYGRLDGEGRMQMDTLQGADWDEVKALREKYGNVGAVFVATNDAGVEWALGQDWIDVVIPFHIVRTGQDIADFYGWSNYSREQADSVVGGSRKMYISPVEHKNDKGAFLEACKRHGVVPRFSKWLDNPNYMKLVNETRLSVDESADLKPVFDMDAAKDSWERFVNRGGYYNGWWNVDAQGYADAVRTVVEDIRSGKMASDAEYGNQRMPVNPEKMIAAARKKRIHGNVPLVDVYDRSGNVLQSGGKRASVRKQKGAASGRELTDGERSLRDALVEKLRGAGIEVIADAEEGKRVLDAEDAIRNGEKLRKQKVKSSYDPRHAIKPVRGEWTKSKIIKRLKDIVGATTGYSFAARRIAEFNSAEELAEHMFYHGTQFGGGRLKPSILMSDSEVGRIGGGGYGKKYWGVSVSRSKRVASNFSSGRGVRIYPIILVKNAKVKEMPELTDAADLEDCIEDLWKEGVDAVWIGDKNAGEQELCVLNPAAIVNIDRADIYEYFKLGTSENPLHVIDSNGIEKLYQDAKRYVDALENKPQKPQKPSRFLPAKDGETIGEMKSDEQYQQEMSEYEQRLDEYNNSDEVRRFEQEDDYARRNIRFFRTADGHAYGFTVNGKIYIDPRIATAETPIHEYAHLWASAMREVNPEEWRNIVGLMKGTGVWDEVKRTYPELKTDDEIADEVLAHYSGRRGAERLRAEQEKIAKGDGDVVEKAEAISALNRVKDALKRFWKGVSDWLGVRFTSAEDVADKVLSDLLNGVDPNAGREGASSARRMQKGSLKHQSRNPEMKTAAYVAEMVALAKAGLKVNVLAEDESYVMDGYDNMVLTPYLYGKFHSDIKRMVDPEAIKNGQESPFVWLYTDRYDYLCQTDENYNVKVIKRYDREGEPANTNRPFVGEKGRQVSSERNSRFHVREKGENGGGNSDAYRIAEDEGVSNNHALDWGNGARGGEVRIRTYKSLPLKNPKGNRIYGWAFGGEIYLTPDGINSESPIHEYTHLWCIAMQRRNRAAWDEIVSLLKGSNAWKDVVKDKGYSNLDTEDRIASEVLSRLSGEHGAKILEREAGKEHEGNTDSARAQTLLDNVKKALEKFWRWVGTDLFQIRSFSSVEEVKDRVLYDFVNGTDLGDVTSDYIEFQRVTDPVLVAELESDDKILVYRGMQLIDGKLYPPMAAKMGGRMVDSVELGVWEQAVERPDLVDKNGKFKLDKANGKSVPAAYNPYIHTSTTPLNDQFAEAQSRPNLVTVEVEVPRSELSGSYKAYGAKDATGVHQWKAGVIQGQLSGTREVILSRYDKPVRIVPDGEVADVIVGMFGGRDIVMPSNVVTPSLRSELEKRGIRFVETDNRCRITEGEHKGELYSRTYGIKNAEGGRKAMLRLGDVPGSVMTAEELGGMRKEAESFASGIGLGEVDVYDRIEDVPGYDGMDERQRRAKGWFDPATGRVAVVAGNHVDAADIQQTVLHEAVAHKGLRELLGDRFDGFLDGVLKNADEGVRAGITDLAKENGWDFRRATEEYLAGLAEDGRFAEAGAGWWKRVKRMFVEMLRAAGFGGRRISDCDLRYVLWRSLSHLKGDTGVLGMAEDVLMQYRLSVGNYGADVTRGAYVGGPLLRDGGGVSDGTREAYDAAVNQGRKGTLRLTRYNFREAFQDELLSLKLLQDIVEKKYGVELRGFEDAYLAENRLASMNEKDRKRFLDMFYEPMMEEVDRLIGDGASQDEINRYIMAKSGLERNREFAVRDYFRDLEKEAREMDDETDRQAALDKIRQDRDAYDSERDRIRQEVRNGTKSWLDAHDELMALAERTVGDALVRDYSGLSGMFGENDFERAAVDFVLSFESGHETDEVWKRIRATNDETLRKCMESGMIDGAARARIGGMFDYYVPLRGFDDKTVDDVYAYVGIEGDGGAGKVMAKAKGRTTVAKDPLAVMAVMGERAILQGNRNWVKQHLLNMALNRPTDVCRAGRMWYVYDPVEQVWKESYPSIPDDATPEEADDIITQWEEDMRIASGTEIMVKDKNGNDVKVKGATQRKEDLNVDYIVPPGSRFRSEHAVRVMRGGKEYVVFVHGNPRAAQAVNGLLKHGADGLMLVYHNLKRMYSSALTQYNVNFAGANIARDVQHSLFITLVNSGVKEAVRLAGYIPRVAPALARYIAGRPKAGSRVDAYVREFMENGGETGYAIAQSVDTWIADNASRTKRVGKGRRAARFAYDMTIGKMADWFSVANRMLEGNTRLAAYVASREGGDSVERAVKKAKDITVNFNKKGSGHTPGGWGQLANFYRNWFMFANPIIQGTFQFYDSMKMHPWRFAGMASTFLTAGMLVPMLNQALVSAFGGDDDDYYNLNEYTRRSNLMLFTGDGYVKIPLPQTLRNLYALGDIVMGVFNGRTDADDALPEMWNELCGMLSLEQLKVGGGLKGFGHNLLGGSMFAPVSDVVFNEKFNGMPIYKENVFGGRRAEYLNVYGGTWSFLVDASRLLNDATNGEYLFARSPYVGQMLNPAVLQHLLTNYTGGIGQAVGDVSSLASDLIGGELSDNFSWRTIPVAKRFYQDMDEITVNSAYKRRFDGIASKLKDLDEEIKETKRRIKDGDRSLYDHLNRLERTEDYGRLRRMKRYQGKIRRAKSPEDVAKIRRMAVDEFEMEADGRRR